MLSTKMEDMNRAKPQIGGTFCMKVSKFLSSQTILVHNLKVRKCTRGIGTLPGPDLGGAIGTTDFTKFRLPNRISIKSTPLLVPDISYIDTSNGSVVTYLGT